jgi:predicted secreted protein
VAGEAVGFWSYVREDDAGDGGRIVDLAHDVGAQYRIQTAEKLDLFVDRDSIEWGEAWKARIDSAIAGTTFFIPILTPSYFESPECRRELLKFAREARLLGLAELLMPIYWVRVSALDDSPETSSDEAVRLVAAYNRETLREERMEDRGSSTYRKAVSRLAEKLANRTQRAQEVKDVPDISPRFLVHLADPGAVNGGEETQGTDADTIPDHLETAREDLAHARDFIDKLKEHLVHVSEKIGRARRQVRDARKSGQAARVVSVLTDELAQEIKAPSRAIGRLGHAYSEVLAEADPSMQVALDAMDSEAPRTDQANGLLAEITELLQDGRLAERRLAKLMDSVDPIAELSRSLTSPRTDLRSGLLGVLDGNNLADEWAVRVLVLSGHSDASRLS